jgi:hypothetical protein
MADFNLTQAEAEALMALEKGRIDEREWPYPGYGDRISIPLHSLDKREDFIMDISRSQINLNRGKYQERARVTVILVRLDLGGAPHQNPDGKEILCPHVHVYREGYGDKWASPLSATDFSDPSDLWRTLADFMRYCHITQPPRIKKGLFV